ncbi:MAG TPA: FapA family protein, partial [Desulfosarcina sp.]|nr:FapA family protein [Desulfosarcina sp.]
MTVENDDNRRFGEIAIEMNIVDQVKVDKALVVQRRIFEKTRVNMPIGEILVEMGAISAAMRDEILQIQNEVESKPAGGGEAPTPDPPKTLRRRKNAEASLEITVAKDKLTVSAFIDGECPVTDMGVEDVKIMLHADGILYGIAEDETIAAFLKGEFAVGESWDIATGTEPVPDAPPEIVYHFDTDPLKVGTLTEEGLMDWKERGQLPQVKEGDLLAEKIPGPRGKEGMDVYGKKIPIPKAREKRFKCGKGARRSEDGLQVYASLSGIPKLSLGGDLTVMPILHIQGDISLETGHVEFEGHIDVAGAVEK